MAQACIFCAMPATAERVARRRRGGDSLRSIRPLATVVPHRDRSTQPLRHGLEAEVVRHYAKLAVARLDVRVGDPFKQGRVLAQLFGLSTRRDEFPLGASQFCTQRLDL